MSETAEVIRTELDNIKKFSCKSCARSDNVLPISSFVTENFKIEDCAAYVDSNQTGTLYTSTAIYINKQISRKVTFSWPAKSHDDGYSRSNVFKTPTSFFVIH